MKNTFSLRVVVFLTICITAYGVEASPVSYAAELFTTKLNPVTNVLILEQDGSGTVHGTLYGSDVSGNGMAVINHNPPFTPVRSLIIGLTEGQDPDGNDKVQIIMFLNQTFADSIRGLKWSSVFPGTRHSVTITSLLAATAGDADEVAWFTDTFFTGPGASAVFDTGTAFAVGEFSSFDVIGNAFTAGDWVLNQPIDFPDKTDSDAIEGLLTVLIDESARSDGPFDLRFQVDGQGQFAVGKQVTNNSGHSWRQFIIEVGEGIEGSFAPSGNVDFRTSGNREETGAFPELHYSLSKLIFTGGLAPDETAEFIFFVNTRVGGGDTVTIRQSALAEAEPIPGLRGWSLVLLVMVLGALAVVRLRAGKSV